MLWCFSHLAGTIDTAESERQRGISQVSIAFKYQENQRKKDLQVPYKVRTQEAVEPYNTEDIKDVHKAVGKHDKEKAQSKTALGASISSTGIAGARRGVRNYELMTASIQGSAVMRFLFPDYDEADAGNGGAGHIETTPEKKPRKKAAKEKPRKKAANLAIMFRQLCWYRVR